MRVVAGNAVGSAVPLLPKLYPLGKKEKAQHAGAGPFSGFISVCENRIGSSIQLK
jgi:hypothetical protein